MKDTIRRKLSDLYVRGIEVAFEEGDFSIWVQKLSPVEHATAVRKANAARSRYLAMCQDRDCEEYQSVSDTFRDLERDDLIELLLSVERNELIPKRDAEISHEEEWAKDDYLSGLRDSWMDEMKDRFERDADDQEAKRVSEELDRFIAQVLESVENALAIHRESLEILTDEKLFDKVIEQRIKTKADTEWVTAFYKWEMLLAVRDPENHKISIFDSISDIDELQSEVFGRIHQALRDLTVDPMEGKGLAETPPSSPLSEQSEVEATEASSGPRIVEA